MSVCRINTICFTDGEDGAPLLGQYVNRDLSLYSAIALKIKRCDGCDITVPGVITDAANGEYQFEFDSSNLIVGEHEAEIVLTLSGSGKTEIWPDCKRDIIVLEVRERVTD